MKGWPAPLESDLRDDRFCLVSVDEEESGEGMGVVVVTEGENEVGVGVTVVGVEVVAVMDGLASWLTKMHAIPKLVLSLRRVRRPRVLACSNEPSGRNVH